MISTTYTISRELESNETVLINLQVSVVDEVIGTNEGYRNTVKSKVVVTLPLGYSTLDLEDAIRAEGFDL